MDEPIDHSIGNLVSKPPLPRMPNPEQIEQLLSEKIAHALQISPDDTLLGFLNVDDETQQAVLSILKNRLVFESINQYLRRYPALTSYGLAVAVSIGLQEKDIGPGAIYGAWRQTIGYYPDQSKREPLANDFRRALLRLGLPVGTISPEREFHWSGGCFLFHGAILPHFVQPLQRALETVQKREPLPDLDDTDRVRAFASTLSNQVDPGQNRLRKTLLSDVGPLLVRRLIQWLHTHDDALFPAHIRPLLVEQRKASVFLRGPYIQFDESEGQMLLVLPAQTSRLADSGTRWTVNGRSYRANQEQPPLPLQDLGIQSDRFEVVLSRLIDGRPDYTCTLDAGIPPERGFRVFDAADGKERKLAKSTEPTIELPPGQSYLIALCEDAVVLSDHAEMESDSFRYLDAEISPKSEPIRIEHQGIVWRLIPKVRPGIYLSTSDGNRFSITREENDKQVMVHYGCPPTLTLVVPQENGSSMRVHFATAGANDHSETFGSIGEPQNSLFDASEMLQRWVNQLPNAVHCISVGIECGNQRMTDEFWYWKGLQTITMYGDFICSELPINLESSKGLERNGNKLERPTGSRTRAILCFSATGSTSEEKWLLPSDLVNINLALPDELPVPIDEDTTVEILHDDKRTIQIKSGGLVPMALYCGDRYMGEVSPEKRPLSRHLSTLTAEFGRTGCLTAKPLIELPGNRSRSVLRWQTPQMAESCRLENETDSKMVVWLVRKVSITGISGLRVRILDLVSKVEGKEVEDTLPLVIPDQIDSSSEISPGSGFSCSVMRKEQHVQVRISFDRSVLQGVIWVVDLECQLNDSEVWQPIMVPEKYGRVASIRFLLIGGTPDSDKARRPETSLFWGNPREDLSENSYALQLKGAELDRWVQCIRWLIDWKYPTPVWKQNGGRFQSLYRRLSRICLFKGDAERTMWWKHAIDELQKHAQERQPVVTPCLLMASNLKMAATPVEGVKSDGWGDDGLIARCFREAVTFETREDQSDLNYLSGVFRNQRLPTELLACFSGWKQLLAGKSGKLGEFDYIDWSSWLTMECRKLEFSAGHEHFAMLSPAHFVTCLAKAKKRIEVLQRIADMDQSHWLSFPIAQLRVSGDHTASAASSILGKKLGGAPDGILVQPLERMDHGMSKDTLLELTQSMIMASGLLALALRAKAVGLISTESLLNHRHTLVPTMDRDSDLDEALSTQLSLILGTAPELFAFYFLLFTLTLSSTDEPRN